MGSDFSYCQRKEGRKKSGNENMKRNVEIDV